MEKCLSRFEDLPNELIIDICKYLNAREIFQSFYNINYRFKILVESFDNLQLTISLFDSNEKKNYEKFFLYIQILIIDRGINIDLKHFKKLHRLMLRNPNEKIFEQLNHYSLPHIEYLSINHKFLTSTIQSLINNLYQRIFSNHFSNLKFCNLSEMKIEIPIENWQQSLSLNILKVGEINIFIYRAILSTCPNLYFFELKKLQHNELLLNIKLHFNLKQLIIKDDDQSFPWNDRFINDYIICVPNLENLTIHRINFFKKIEQYLNYDWFSSKIIHCLYLLRQFNFILHIYDSKRLTKCYRENIFCALKEHFLYLHKDRYQVRIKFVQE
ncbi:unnamed protein product [Rotaria sordida]|uniref:F-box domain-containing protein n=1 Tax=Rotaria sordida TaxID=392033 RepID=A0A814WN52_9BILA|nr:unnamed protein product [Rotaria sordida]